MMPDSNRELVCGETASSINENAFDCNLLHSKALRKYLSHFIDLALALPKSLGKRMTEFDPRQPADSDIPLPRPRSFGMGLELLSMSFFWAWNAFQPALQPAPVVAVVPSKVILQATWIEPVSVRDETSKPEMRQPATNNKPSLNKRKPTGNVQKTKKPLWKATKTWELPPILWAGFEAFLAAGLGIVSLIKP